jgi:hypothetical protein
MTFGGLLPLGGSGRAFLPQPESVRAEAIQIADSRLSIARMLAFMMVLFIKRPGPMIY